MLQFWTDFINSLRNKRDDSSQIAVGRLKGAVSMDRLSLPPSTLDQIRTEVVRTISRYLVIDESSMTLAVQADGRHVALAASIPVLRPRATPLPEGPTADSGAQQAAGRVGAAPRPDGAASASAASQILDARAATSTQGGASAPDVPVLASRGAQSVHVREAALPASQRPSLAVAESRPAAAAAASAAAAQERARARGARRRRQTRR